MTNRKGISFAWALLEAHRDELEIFDARMPLFWRREVAAQYNTERCNGKARIVRVEIYKKKTKR